MGIEYGFYLYLDRASGCQDVPKDVFESPRTSRNDNPVGDEICRNATINEDANCTHYLEGDGREGLQQERESTEEEDGDGEEEDGEEEGDVDVGKLENELLSQKAGDDYCATPCDACDRQESGGAGRLPGAVNTCWSAAEDD